MLYVLSPVPLISYYLFFLKFNRRLLDSLGHQAWDPIDYKGSLAGTMAFPCSFQINAA